jgi:hypothetical protein
MHQARLLPDAMDAQVRHDPDRLALAVHDVCAEVQGLTRSASGRVRKSGELCEGRGSGAAK